MTDERGYTQPMGHDGRMLTKQGLVELRMALTPEQVGFIREKLELMAFQTTFDPRKRSGQLPINTSLIQQDRFKEALEMMKDVSKAVFCVSDMVAVASETEKLGSVVIPAGKIGLATICSAVVNGVLLKAGIPIESRFGGVLEVRDGEPRRFVAIINYDGTSLDPSEQYIRARMTSVGQAAKTGNGKILANFHELPAPSRAMVEEKIELLHEAGVNGVYMLGNTSQPVCQVTVAMNRVGMVLLGGLNPVAAAVEAGIESENIGESGLIDYQQLVSIDQL